jgi:hypothetical protein
MWGVRGIEKVPEGRMRRRGEPPLGIGHVIEIVGHSSLALHEPSEKTA